MAEARVVFLHGLHPRIVEAIISFNPAGFATTVVDGKSPEAQQVEAVKEADFIMAFRATLTERILRSARKARLVQILSAGYDRINLKLLRELKIPCANNGGANSWAVADHAVLAMLSLYRRLNAADRTVREGRWSAAIDGMNTFEMAGKVVGVLGFGNIGQKVARRVQAFDATVQYYDKFPLAPDRERELKAKRVSLEELFRTSDIISCHAPLTNETRHVVNRERLAMMKPTAVIINTSRGPVVDEAAITEALQQKRIAGAGLDVFEKEPVDPGNPLLKLENVVVSPHSAGTTWDTWFRRADFAYKNMKRVWDGQPPQAVATDYDSENP
jgi:phosphoglycerate dehydrogenase-like enzyme